MGVLKQQLPGGVNDGVQTFDCMDLNSTRYIISASGTAVLILSAELQTVQTIRFRRLVNAVRANRQGQIAAIHGNSISIIKPCSGAQPEGPPRWEVACKFRSTSEPATCSWHPTLDRLLIGGTSLELWMAESNPEYLRLTQSQPSLPYVLAWSKKTPSPTSFLEYSPDGRLFASCGCSDRLVRVWFPRDIQLYTMQDTVVQYDFVFLPHPRKVTSLSWRWPVNYPQDGTFLVNALLTCCFDNIARFWVETDCQEPFLFYTAGTINLVEACGECSPAALQSLSLHWANPKELSDAVSQSCDGKSKAAKRSLNHLTTVPHSAQLDKQSRVVTAVSSGLKRVFSEHVMHLLPFKGHMKAKPSVVLPSRLRSAESTKSAVREASALHDFRPEVVDARPVWLRRWKPDDYSLHDMVFAILPSGSLVFWQVPGLDARPRSIVRITRTAKSMKILSQWQASSTRSVLLFPDTNQFLFLSSVDLPPPHTHNHTWEYEIHRPLPVALLAIHTDGSISKWVANFSPRSDFSSLLSLEHIADSGGHCYPVTFTQRHPFLPLFASVARDQVHGCSELILWQVTSVSAISGRASEILHCLFKLKGTHESFTSFTWVASASAGIFVTGSSKHLIEIFHLRPSLRSQTDDSVAERPSLYESIVCLGSLSAASSQASENLHDHLVTHLDTEFPLVHAFWVVSFSFASAKITYWRVVLSNDRGSELSFHSHMLDEAPCFSSELGGRTVVSAKSTTQVWTPSCRASAVDEHVELIALTCSSHEILLLTLTCSHPELQCQELTLDNLSESVQHAMTQGKCAVKFETVFSQANSKCKLVTLAFASSGRCAVAYEALTTDTTESDTRDASPEVLGDHVRIFERESSGSQFRREFVISCFEAPTSIDWISVNGHHHLLVVATPSRMTVYAHSSSKITAWMPLIQTPLESTVPGTVSWAFDGALVHAAGNHLKVYSKWIDASRGDVIRFIPSVKKVSAREHVFALSEHLHGSLPFYHPKQLISLLHRGKFELVERVLIYLYNNLIGDEEADNDEGGVSSEQHLDSRRTKLLGYSQLVRVLAGFSLVQDFVELNQAPAASAPKPLFFASAFAAGAGFSTDTTKNRTFSKVSAQLLAEKLIETPLPDLSNTEQLTLIGLIESFADIQRHRESLDQNGVRFFILARLFSSLRARLPENRRPPPMPAVEFVWALHSQSQDLLLDLCLSSNEQAAVTWSDFAAFGIGYWLVSQDQLKKFVEKIAQLRFQSTQDPLKSSLFYLALRKKNVLWGLFKTKADIRMSTFFGNNFDEPRWKEAALKNAFALLTKQKYEEAAAFFLLGDDLADATHVCIRNLEDVQLALVIARLYEGENSPTYKSILLETVLASTDLSDDVALRSMGFWLLKEYKASYEVLTADRGDEPTSTTASSEAASPSQTAPILSSAAILNLCQQLQTDSQVKTHAQAIGIPHALFHRASYEYAQLGLPLLALHVLLSLDQELVAAIRSKESQAYLLTNSGTLTTASSAPSSSTTKPASKSNVSDMINSGTFDFSAFDDGFGDFAEEPDEPVAEEPDVPAAVETNFLSQQASSHEQVLELQATVRKLENDLSLTHSLRWSLCTQVLCESLRRISKAGQWKAIRDRIRKDWSALKTLCGLEGFAESDGMGTPGILNLLKRFCRLQGLTHSEGAITLHDHPTRLDLLASFVGYSTEFIRVETSALLHLCGWPSDDAYERCKKLLIHFFEFLHEFLQERVVMHQPKLSASVVFEALFSSYYAMFSVAWGAKDWDMILKLLTNTIDSTVLEVLLRLSGAMQSVSTYQSQHFLQSLRSPFSQNLTSDSPGDSDGELDSSGPQSARRVANGHRARTTGVADFVRRQGILHFLTKDVPLASFKSVDACADPDFDEKEEPVPACVGPHFTLASAHLTAHLRAQVSSPTNSPDTTASTQSKDAPSELGPLPPLQSSSTVSGAKASNAPLNQNPEDPDLALQFYWALLELVAVQNICFVIREARPMLNYSVDDLNQASSVLFNVFTAIEVRMNQLECLLNNLPTPRSLLDQVKDADASYPAQAIFPIRSLLVPSANPFKTVAVRRIWHLLVNTSCVRSTIEHYIFRASRSASETPSRSASDTPSQTKFPTPLPTPLSGSTMNGIAADSSLKMPQPSAGPTSEWKVLYKAGMDVNSFCMVSQSAFTFALATSRGLTELKVTGNLDDIMAQHSDASAMYSGTPLPSTELSRPVSQISGLTSSFSSGTELVAGQVQLGIARPLPPVTRTRAHPSLPFFVAGGLDGALRLFQFEQEQFSSMYCESTHHSVGRIRFDDFGSKFSVLERNGELAIWRFDNQALNQPIFKHQVHSKADGLAFLNSASFLATGGTSANSYNIRLWDTLLPAHRAMLKQFSINDGGNKSLGFLTGSDVLLCGSRRGELAIIDLRQREVSHQCIAHNGSVKAIAVSEALGMYATGGADGLVKLWSTTTHQTLGSYVFGPRGSFLGPDAISELEFSNGYLFASGDGCLKAMKLPEF
eukprot:m.877288 g.877288  ORF g.877288 m.877288 type:complete len:2495 (-) comp59827_c0_seq4:2423-9907(-)